MNTSDLERIIDMFYTDFQAKKSLPYIQSANTSLPIVWFGNLEKYFSSKIKILTIGLNPSLKEFEEERFPNVANAFEIHDYESVAKGLNQYFTCNPYKIWFTAYERVLNCSNWNATYGGQVSRNLWAKNYAIHIDCFSAIATNPTWSRLDNVTKANLQQVDLFDRLFEFLNPDIVLFSTSEDDICEHFKLFRVNALNKSLPNTINNYVREYTCKNKDGKDVLFVWGKANVKPFQGVPTTLLNEYFDLKTKI